MATTTSPREAGTARAEVTIDYSHPSPCTSCGAGTARRVDGTPMHGGICETIARTRRA